jgi:putative transposase
MERSAIRDTMCGMVNYRRARVPGATYFFTVTLRDRRKDWLTAYVDLLRRVVRGVRLERPFHD